MVRVIIIQVIAFLPRLKNINEMPSRCPYYVRIKGGFPLAQRGCMLPSLGLKSYMNIRNSPISVIPLPGHTVLTPTILLRLFEPPPLCS